MGSEELELKWKSIIHREGSQYTSLRISSVCVPEMYLAADIKGNRFLILQVPWNIDVKCLPVTKENLSLEWHQESRFILIGLLSKQFSDLFNDLTISLYNRIKNLSDADKYSLEFISSFNKWSDFFEDKFSGQLSESELKGLFGELTVLNWLLINAEDYEHDEILKSWQGPYGCPQDFVLPNVNIEVKTKSPDDVTVRISSEYQLEKELSKLLQLAVVNAVRSESGESLSQLINKIRTFLLKSNADISIFLKTISKAGISLNDVVRYDNYRWNAIGIILFDCASDSFPKIITSQIQPELSCVRYELNVDQLDDFIIQNILL